METLFCIVTRNQDDISNIISMLRSVNNGIIPYITQENYIFCRSIPDDVNEYIKNNNLEIINNLTDWHQLWFDSSFDI